MLGISSCIDLLFETSHQGSYVEYIQNQLCPKHRLDDKKEVNDDAVNTNLSECTLFQPLQHTVRDDIELFYLR